MINIKKQKIVWIIISLVSGLVIIFFIFFLNPSFNLLGQGRSPFPSFPQRIIYLTSEISKISEESMILNKELLNLIRKCDCKYARSNCKQVEILGLIRCKAEEDKISGNVCPLKEAGPDETEPGINGLQLAINDLNIHFSLIQALLKEELDDGLKRQLEILESEEEAEILKKNLEDIQKLSNQMREITEKNRELPEQCDIDKCIPQCEYRADFKLKACIIPGQNKPIETEFEVGVKLEDLKIDLIKVENINLNLPKEIDLPDPPTIPGFKDNIKVKFTLACPTEKTQTLKLPLPKPRLPEPPVLKLSCPEDPKGSDYSCEPSSDQGEIEGFNELDWHFQIFSYLNGECLKVVKQDLTTLTNPIKKEKYEKLIQSCSEPERVISVITLECEKSWKWDSIKRKWVLSDPESQKICDQIGHLTKTPPMPPTRLQRQIEWCRKLFEERGEEPPDDCSSPFDNIPRIKKKCEEIKNKKEKEIPLSCKLLPLLSMPPGKLELPPEMRISGKTRKCPAQKITDSPYFPIKGCKIGIPSFPKIKFPPIEIPDITGLPSFRLTLPFINFDLIDIRLPNIIFEDLVFPEIDLCNLDECQYLFPDLEFKIPSLKIPEIIFPPRIIEIRDTDIKITIEIPSIKFPDLDFKFPQLLNLISFTLPEIEIPEIPSLPKPELIFKFKGIKIDLIGILIGLLVEIKILPPSCHDFNFKLIPIIWKPPDFYIRWPGFPEIPDFCEDIRKFCKDAKKSINEVVAKVPEIQKKVNTIFENKIQKKLDDAAKKLNEEIAKEFSGKINSLYDAIKEEIYRHLPEHASGYVAPPSPIAPMPGVWQVVKELSCDLIPPFTYSTSVPITIPEIPLRKYISEEDWPDKIPIEWPEELKKITLTLEKHLKYLPAATTIPLSKLSYTRKIPVKIPWLQLPHATIDFDFLKNPTACKGGPPKGGNPCPADEIRDNLKEIEKLNKEIEESAQKIENILDIFE